MRPTHCESFNVHVGRSPIWILWQQLCGFNSNVSASNSPLRWQHSCILEHCCSHNHVSHVWNCAANHDGTWWRMRCNHQNVLDSTDSASMETHICRATRAFGTFDETLWTIKERMWNKTMKLTPFLLGSLIVLQVLLNDFVESVIEMSPCP